VRERGLLAGAFARRWTDIEAFDWVPDGTFHLANRPFSRVLRLYPRSRISFRPTWYVAVPQSDAQAVGRLVERFLSPWPGPGQGDILR
jgi:hypothetical protein